MYPMVLASGRYVSALNAQLLDDVVYMYECLCVYLTNISERVCWNICKLYMALYILYLEILSRSHIQLTRMYLLLEFLCIATNEKHGVYIDTQTGTLVQLGNHIKNFFNLLIGSLLTKRLSMIFKNEITPGIVLQYLASKTQLPRLSKSEGREFLC